MKKIDANYSEQYLLPPSIEDWLSADHPARFIREVVENLKFDEMGFRIPEARTGRPPYAETLLLRVWLYGYWKRIRSSRKLEEACGNDIGFIWLCGNQAPDHNTLWRFFKSNKKALKKVFRQTVKTAVKMDMVGFAVQALDGTKIQAACGGGGSWDEKHLRKALERLDEIIQELEESIEKEERSTPNQPAGLPERLRSAERLRESVKEALEKVQSGETKHCHPVDGEARRMGCEGRNRFSQNAQAVVDEKNHVIVGEDVTPEAYDNGQLSRMTREALSNTERKPEAMVADGGYYDAEEIAETEKEISNVLLPVPAGSANEEENPYHTSRFQYDKERDAVICPEGKALPFNRERVKNERTGQRVREFRSREACRGCPVRERCTKNRHGRSIDLPMGHEAAERLKERLEDPDNQETLKKRGRIVEVVFAWIKQMDGFRRWTAHGLENAKAQWSMLCAVWNLKKIYRKWVERNKAESAKQGNPTPLGVTRFLHSFCSPIAERAHLKNHCSLA